MPEVPCIRGTVAPSNQHFGSISIRRAANVFDGEGRGSSQRIPFGETGGATWVIESRHRWSIRRQETMWTKIKNRTTSMEEMPHARGATARRPTGGERSQTPHMEFARGPAARLATEACQISAADGRGRADAQHGGECGARRQCSTWRGCSPLARPRGRPGGHGAHGCDAQHGGHTRHWGQGVRAARAIPLWKPISGRF